MWQSDSDLGQASCGYGAGGGLLLRNSFESAMLERAELMHQPKSDMSSQQTPKFATVNEGGIIGSTYRRGKPMHTALGFPLVTPQREAQMPTP
jgi:hypothetical protein